MHNRKLCISEDEELFQTNFGYVIYKIDEMYCDLCLIEIDNGEKNQGLGTVLMKKFINKIKTHGIKEVYLDAWVTTEGIYDIETLVKFYKKFGFKETERMDDDGQIRVFMCLEL
ncbi:MAG: GNAT family N-acetyltransferase [Arcobacteraceae bacterium]